MTKGNGLRVMRMFCTLLLLLVPASAKGSQPGTPQQTSQQNARQSDPHSEQAGEQSLWDSIKNGEEAQEYKTFLRKLPHGQFAAAARARLGDLLGEDFVTLFVKRIDADRQWSNVEKQLERRADVIPKLFETLVAAGVQEQEFYGQMAEWRSRLLNATRATPRGEGETKTAEQKRSVIEADNGLSKTLRRIDSLLENYPQLRSNEFFLKRQDELAGVENRITVARTDYNSAVLDYNTVRKEPRMAGVAERYGFAEEPHFESEPGQSAEPKVNSVPAISMHPL